MKTIAILACKLLRFAGKLLGKGSSLPGSVALKLDPDILQKIKLPDRVIAVTGSNGKTSTVEMIAHVLRQNGWKVAYNREGSNQIEGVTTFLLSDCTLGGTCRSDVILLDAEIGQKTIRARYQVDDYWEGWDELVTLPQAVQGVRMKDGSEHICGASTSGFEDQENMIYFTEADIYDAILDINQVESLMFRKGLELDGNGERTIQTFYYIPVSVG